MESEIKSTNKEESMDNKQQVTYRADKDFYKGVKGEFRLKAEGLFKKAKQKGISIEEINIVTLKENHRELPGLGIVELPTFIVKVKGRQIETGQMIVDAKQIDYQNRYQKYIAGKIYQKNIIRDNTGNIVRENGRVKVKDETELVLSDWESFEIAKDIIEDKEFGLEKTITGACDRVIRKLMGENDWIYEEEARLLDEEFSDVQKKINQEKLRRSTGIEKKATKRQINYLKTRIKTLGLDAEKENVIKEILKQAGFNDVKVEDLSTGEMSKVIENVNEFAQRVKEQPGKQNYIPGMESSQVKEEGHGYKQ